MNWLRMPAAILEMLPQKTSDFGNDSTSIFSCVWRIVVIIMLSKYFCWVWTHLMCISWHFGSVNWQPDRTGWLVNRFSLRISWLTAGTIQMPFLGSVRIIMTTWPYEWNRYNCIWCGFRVVLGKFYSIQAAATWLNPGTIQMPYLGSVMIIMRQIITDENVRAYRQLLLSYRSRMILFKPYN